MEGIGRVGMHAAGNPSEGDERGSDATADRSLAAFRGRRGAEEKARKAKFERKRGGKRRRKKHNQMCHRMARRQWQQWADRNEAAMLTKNKHSNNDSFLGGWGVGGAFLFIEPRP